MKPRALDLFCGAGGASEGLSWAGFEVYGVDTEAQRRYPFWFLRTDWATVDLAGYDFIWASPPCQRFSPATPAQARDRYPDLIEPVRRALEASGALYCIENVPPAPVRPDLVLTGNMFGLGVIRRRHFELNFAAAAPGPVLSGYGLVKQGKAVTVAGGGGAEKGQLSVWREAMGIDWMTRREIAQAIPPAYAECIGRQARKALEDRCFLRWQPEDQATEVLGVPGPANGSELAKNGRPFLGGRNLPAGVGPL